VAYQKNNRRRCRMVKTFHAKMKKLGWVKPTTKKEEKVIHLFEYFEVLTLKGTFDFYQ
jgi:predicted DNA-binding protein with PD1-like motif